MSSLKIAIIAGEASGDLLGADLIASLKKHATCSFDIIGVGGDALIGQGLKSLFDFSELSLMGITQVLAQLPKLLWRIQQTADAIIQEKPDILIIVDSPDFTHRVAKRVRAALPDLPVVDYVCPSVWAWKSYRAVQMRAYTDHVLAVLPFEPEVMQKLGGPPTTYIGHRLASDASVLRIRAARENRTADVAQTIMLLPGSRASEIKKLMPYFRDAVEVLINRNNAMNFVLPTLPQRETLVRHLVHDWPVQPDIVVGSEGKEQAFIRADAAIAASGTVLLELALAGIPAVSAYKTDWIIKMMAKRIKTWTGALPNLIADYPVIPEYLNEVLRGASLARWMERLSSHTIERQAMLEGYDLVWRRMQTALSPGDHAAMIVRDIAMKKKPDCFQPG